MSAATSGSVGPQRRVAVEQALRPALGVRALDERRRSLLAPGQRGVESALGRRSCAQCAALLDREDLVQAATVARLAAERRGEERQRALEGGLGADDPRAEGQHVHVVVLDALVRRVRVVAHGGAHAADLVRGDARADAGAADEDPAIHRRRRGPRARAARRSPGSRRSGRSRRRRGRRACRPGRAAATRRSSSAFSAAPA